MAYPNNNSRPKIRPADRTFFEEVLYNSQRALRDKMSPYIVRDISANRFYIADSYDPMKQLELRQQWLARNIAKISQGETPREPGWDFAWAPYAEVMNGASGSFADNVAALGHVPTPIKARVIPPTPDGFGQTLDEYNKRKEIEKHSKETLTD